MKRAHLLLGLAPFVLLGCFGSHGGGGGASDSGASDSGAADAATRDSRVADSATARWVTCDAALTAGATGDSCSFGSGCSRDGDCGGSESVACVRGRLVRDDDVVSECGRLWTSCGTFLAEGGGVGEPCEPGTFGVCSQAEGPCCQRGVACEGGFVEEFLVCDDEVCPEMLVCPDYRAPPPVDPACRLDTDCVEGFTCLAPPFDGSCGPCFSPETICVDDGDCSGSDRCQPSPPRPCSCGDDTWECMPDCNVVDDACGAHEVCGGDGRCLPQQCTDGYDCGFNSDCAFGGVTTDEHGCVRRSCMVDLHCECGACVEFECRSGPGICVMPAP